MHHENVGEFPFKSGIGNAVYNNIYFKELFNEMVASGKSSVCTAALRQNFLTRVRPHPQYQRSSSQSQLIVAVSHLRTPEAMFD